MDNQNHNHQCGHKEGNAGNPSESVVGNGIKHHQVVAIHGMLQNRIVNIEDHSKKTCTKQDKRQESKESASH